LSLLTQIHTTHLHQSRVDLHMINPPDQVTEYIALQQVQVLSPGK